MPNDNDDVVIKRYRLLELLKAEAELSLLEELGVDNWDGYSEYLIQRKDLEY